MPACQVAPGAHPGLSLTFRELFRTYAAGLQSARANPKPRLMAILKAHRDFAHASPETYLLAFTTTAPEQRADAAELDKAVRPIQDIMAELVGARRSLPALRGSLALVHGFVMLDLKEQLRRGRGLDEAFELAIEAYLAGWRR